MKKIKLNKLDMLSFAKLQALLFGLVGLILGLLYSVGGFIIDSLVTLGLVSSVATETPGLSNGTILAFGAILGMPLIGVVSGFVLGLVGAFVYNVFAKYIARVELRVE